MWYEMKWEILEGARTRGVHWPQQGFCVLLQVEWGPLKDMKHMTWFTGPLLASMWKTDKRGCGVAGGGSFGFVQDGAVYS